MPPALESKLREYAADLFGRLKVFAHKAEERQTPPAQPAASPPTSPPLPVHCGPQFHDVVCLW
jgi:hypothetical protein